MRITIAPATKRGDVLRCQYLIAEYYNRRWGVVFSRTDADPNARIEPYPHRFVMGMLDGEVVAAAGLFVGETYVERFGEVTAEDLTPLLEEAGVADQYDATKLRQYTKLSVREDLENTGLEEFFLAATHARAFLQAGREEGEAESLLVLCGTASEFERYYTKAGIHTRLIKPFPIYAGHDKYAKEEDPMESRLVIPSLDLPARWYDLALPGDFDVPAQL